MLPARVPAGFQPVPAPIPRWLHPGDPQQGLVPFSSLPIPFLLLSHTRLRFLPASIPEGCSNLLVLEDAVTQGSVAREQGLNAAAAVRSGMARMNIQGWRQDLHLHPPVTQPTSCNHLSPRGCAASGLFLVPPRPICPGSHTGCSPYGCQAGNACLMHGENNSRNNSTSAFARGLMITHPKGAKVGPCAGR